jgi:hypothetical protein
MGSKFLTRQRGLGSGYVLSRRNIFKGAAGVAAAGAVGVVLTDDASPALAAQDETVESAAVAPSVVNLTDAATIVVDASLGNDFRVTIAGSRTMGTPVNPANGQQVIFQVTQGSAGPFELTWASGYEFPANLPQPSLSTGAGQTDLFGFVYNAADGTWLFVGFVNGFD